MSTIVIGIGNYLMSDEGVGVHVARWLTDHDILPSGTEVLDGGTGGFHLMGHFQNYDRVVLVDATADGNDPGTVSKIVPQYASEYPPTLTAHDVGLKDLIEALYLLDARPEIVLFTVSIDMPVDVGIELSNDVAASVPRVAGAVAEFLAGDS